MPHVVMVRPTGAGWCVEAEFLAAPLMFTSGGKAEATAKRLALALASTGKWAEIQVFAKDWKLAGRYACPPQVPPDDFGAHLSDDMTKQERAASPRAPSLTHRQMVQGHSSWAHRQLNH